MTGLSVAFDLPTQIGFDSDDPRVGEEVGRVGVAIDSLADMELLFDGIPLDKVSTNFTINTTSAPILAMYMAVGAKQGVPLAQLRGTLQNDPLKEYIARGTWLFPVDAALRLTADVINFSAEASSLKKGETLKDTAKNLEALNADVIIIRHSATGAPHFLHASPPAFFWLGFVSTNPETRRPVVYSLLYSLYRRRP